MRWLLMAAISLGWLLVTAHTNFFSSSPAAYRLFAQTVFTTPIRVQIDLVTIEVAALDRKGRPVTSFKKEDFKLFEDGRQQEILSFESVRCDAPGAASSLRDLESAGMKGKIALILFDDSTTAPGEIKTVRDAAETYVRKHMRPGDWMGVAVFWRSLRITQNFTQDAAQVIEAIRKPASSLDLIGRGNGAELNLMRGLISLTSSLERPKGHKIVFLFTNDFPSPSLDHYEKLLALAQRSDVSFYTLIAHQASATAGKKRTSNNGPFRPSGPVARGLHELPLVADSYLAPQQSNINVPMGPPYARSARGDCLRSIAEKTSGGYVQESSDLTAALDSFDQEFCTYYLLGFQSNNPGRDGSLRKIEVKTDAKGIRLKHRTGYVDSRPLDTLAGGKTEKSLMDAISARMPFSQVPLSFRTLFYYNSPHEASALVFSRLAAQATEGRVRRKRPAAVDLMGVAYSEDGRIAARFSGTFTSTTGIDGGETGPKEDAILSSYFRLRPGKYRLKLAAADKENKVGTAEETLVIPALSADAWGVSSLVVSQKIEPLPELVQNMQAGLLDKTDPLIYRGRRISTSVENRFIRQKPLLILYKLYNWRPEESSQPLTANIRLTDDTGVTNLLRPLYLDKTVELGVHGEITIGFSLPIADKVPGKYRLNIETVDGTGRHSVSCQTQIILE